jgi:hypothetical protein
MTRTRGLAGNSTRFVVITDISDTGYNTPPQHASPDIVYRPPA